MSVENVYMANENALGQSEGVVRAYRILGDAPTIGVDVELVRRDDLRFVGANIRVLGDHAP